MQLPYKSSSFSRASTAGERDLPNDQQDYSRIVREYRLFMVRRENNGGRLATSENNIYSKLHVWIIFQAHFKNNQITYKANLEHI
jgi:hypothetical protein